MNHTELWDTEFVWCSPSITHWICLNGLEHSLGIHTFRPTWLPKFLQPQAKFLWPSDYCTVINCPFIFGTRNVFFCFRGVMPKFKLVKQIFELDYVSRLSMQLSNHTWSEAMHQLPRYYQPQRVPSCFDHVIYALQSSKYKNITKLLIQPSKTKVENNGLLCNAAGNKHFVNMVCWKGRLMTGDTMKTNMFIFENLT